jgi:predicted CoA-binding protein
VSAAPSSFENPPDRVIREILATPKTFAVVGCSPDPARDSNEVAALLQRRGHRVIPVNPGHGEILGERSYRSVRDIPEPVDVVDVFRRPEAVAAIADEAIAIGAKVLWLQLGVIDETSARRAADAGLVVVMDRCPAIEYRRLF